MDPRVSGQRKAILKTGILPIQEPVTELDLETPGGLVHATCRCRDGKVLQVKFRHVPSFVHYLGVPVEVKGMGTLVVDVAYGGMHFDHTSIIGTHFFAEVVATTRVGRMPAVVTTVAGRGYLTDIGQYGLDPDDPLPEGFTLADTWLKPVTSLQK